MKKYDSILRYGKRETHAVLEGNPTIVIQEKIDGANASFELVNGEVFAFSRNMQLSELEGLRGFYQWTQANIDPSKLQEGKVYFGEWTAPHKLNYGEHHHKFFLFDVFDLQTEKYADFDTVSEVAERLGLQTAPLFYRGEFQSVEHIQSFVGQSKLGEVGEGVVVKNPVYVDRHGGNVYLKFVSEYFKEAHFSKQDKPKNSGDSLQDFINATLTESRVSKLIGKLVDEGKISEDYAIEDMGTILKSLGNSVFEDIMKEEQDQLFKTLRKKLSRNVPVVVKKVLVAEGRA